MKKYLLPFISLLVLIFSCTAERQHTSKKKGEEDALVARYMTEMIPTERTQNDIDRNLIIDLLIDSLWDFKSTASGIYYDIQKTGTGGAPALSSKVKVHYRGTLLNGKEFDSTYKRNEPYEFKFRGVIAGWQEVIPMLQKGGKGTFVIPSRLAYGPQERKPYIPANSCLIFEIELLDFK